MEKSKHHVLYLAGLEAFADKKKKKVQQEINVLWLEIKSSKKSYDEELKKLQLLKTKKKASLLNFWTKQHVPAQQTTSDEFQIVPSSAVDTTNDEDQPLVNQADTPAQQKIKDDRAAIESRISDLCVVNRTIGLSPELNKEMDRLQKERNALELKPRKKQQNQKAQQKFRDLKRKAVKEISVTHPEAAKSLRPYGTSGRPSLETQPDMLGLYEAILDIGIPLSSADDRRRTEVYNSCQNLSIINLYYKSI